MSVLRLAILNTKVNELQPINLRLIFGMWLATILASGAAFSWGTYMVVRHDYVEANGMITTAMKQRDQLMSVCVMADRAAKQKAAPAKKVAAGLGIGGEEPK